MRITVVDPSDVISVATLVSSGDRNSANTRNRSSSRPCIYVRRLWQRDCTKLKGRPEMNKFLAFLAGCGAGIVAGLLLAPRSGEELRGEISTRVREGYDTVAEKVQE